MQNTVAQAADGTKLKKGGVGVAPFRTVRKFSPIPCKDVIDRYNAKHGSVNGA